MPLASALVASALVASGAMAANAQTSTSPGSGTGSGSISAATHCKDAQGQAQLKSAIAGPGAASSRLPTSMDGPGR
jgi:hypothetical protein